MDVRENTSKENRLIDADKLPEIYKKWIPQLSSNGYKWMWAGKLKEGQA